MAQQKRVTAKMPDGSVQTFNSMEEAQAKAREMGMLAMPAATMQPTSEPKAPPAMVEPRQNAVQTAMDYIRNMISGGQVQMPSFMGASGQGMAAGMVDMMAHPVKNAPAIGGMVGGAAATLLAPELTIPAAILRILGASAGGMGGGLARGDELGPAMQEGAFQGLGQTVLGEVPIGIAQGAMMPLARSSAYHALNPGRETLATVRNPATGEIFPTPGEAANHLKQNVLLQASPQRPGSIPYAHDLIRQIEEARAMKEGILQNSPHTYPTDTGISGGFDKVRQSAWADPNSPGANRQIDDTIETYMKRDWPTTQVTQTIPPPNVPPGPSSPLRPSSPVQKLLSGFTPQPQRSLPAAGETGARQFVAGRAGIAESGQQFPFDFVDPRGPIAPGGTPLPRDMGEVVDLGPTIAAEHGQGLGGLTHGAAIDTQFPRNPAYFEFPDRPPSLRGGPAPGGPGLPAQPVPGANRLPRPTQGLPDIEAYPNVRTGAFEVPQPHTFQVGPPPPMGQATQQVMNIPRNVNEVEVDKLIDGLDKALSRIYDRQAMVSQAGQTAPLDFDAQTLQQIRRNWSEPQNANNPGLPALNQFMSERIPVKEAALAATVPHVSASQGATVGVKAGPAMAQPIQPRFYDFLKIPPGARAQGLRNTANAITGNQRGGFGLGQASPQAARLIQMLLNSQGDNR